MQSTEPLRTILKTYNPSYYTDARLNGLSRNDMEYAITQAGLQDSLALVGPNVTAPVLISRIAGEAANRRALAPPDVGGGGMLPEPAATLGKVYVSNYGNDLNGGRSPGDAKKTLAAAYAALPAAYGGCIECLDRGSGYFDVFAPLVFRKPTYLVALGMESVYARRRFNGDLFTWIAAGGIYNWSIDDDAAGGGTRVGSPIKLYAESTAVRCTSWEMQGVRLTSTGGDINAWEHMLHIDGTLANDPTGNGVRRVQVLNSPMFGCRTPGETFLIVDLVHGHFSGIQMVSSPNEIRQGIKVLSSNRGAALGSEDVEFYGMHMLGDLVFDGVNLSWRGGMLGWRDWDEAVPSVDILSTAQDCLVDGVIRNVIRNRSNTSWVERHNRPRAMFDFPCTIDPLGNGVGYSGLAVANRQYYWRSLGSGYCTKLGLMIGAQVGNISLNVYRPTGRGRAARPDDRRATTGSVACPAPGYAEVALTSGLFIEAGDFIGLSASDTAATFLRGNTPLAAAVTQGRSMYTNASHPGPADVGGMGIDNQGHPIVIVGVE